MFFFRVKPMRISEKDVSWFDGSHTSAVAAVPHVMSADDEMTVWEVSLFLVQSFAKEKRHCNFTN